jgi:hypothetical protein
MLYIVYWRHKEPPRLSHWAYVKADNADMAFDIAETKLQKGCQITAVYTAHSQPTPQNICLNFEPSEITLFG